MDDIIFHHQAPILGIGSVLLNINNYILRLQNVLYVPSLSTSLFSLKEHAQYANCSIRIENNRFFISFPTYTIKKKIGDDLSLTFTLPNDKSSTPHFDSTNAPLSPQSSHTSHGSLKQQLTALRSHPPPSNRELFNPTSLTTSDPELQPTQNTVTSPLSPPKDMTMHLVEDVPLDIQPTISPPSDITYMFPDINDDELSNNGQNISTSPPLPDLESKNSY